MVFPRGAITSGWLVGFGLVAVTLGVALWRRSAEARDRVETDDEDLARLDSDMG